MKKNLKFLMAATLLLLVAANANAQFGVKAGYVNSTVTLKGEGITIKPDAALNGIRVGVDYNIKIGNSGLSFRPGLNYSYMAKNDIADLLLGDFDDYDYEDYDFDIKLNAHFVNVPLDFKFQYSFSDNFGIYAVAGPKVAIGISSKLIETEDGYKYTEDLFSGKWTETYDGDTDSGKDKDDAVLNRVDLQLGFGLGAQYKAWSLEVGYDWGMLNLIKNDVDGIKLLRKQLGVTLGYTF